MNPSLFNVLHDATDHHIFAVRKRVHIHFNRVFQEMINQHRAIVRILHRFFHIADDHLFVVCNYHGPSTQHVGRTHQHRITHPLGTFDRFLHRSRHRPRGLWDIKFVKQLAKALAVFRQVNRLRRRANDIDARSLQWQRQVQRCLPAKLHDHTHGRPRRGFMLADGKHIFQR